MLVSMLYTIAEFNAFQVLVEFRKCDMNEPLILHLTRRTMIPDSWSTSTTEWSIVIVDPAGLALLLDKGTDVDIPNSFLLMKTLMPSCSLILQEANMRAIDLHFTSNGFYLATSSNVSLELSTQR